ncbi:fibronectin type III domain-containing protein [Winogradskyella sp.]|nr:hypothetical protein [Winogradskyella sp.]MDA8874904.1 fibronectin type III domain-containing protein [Winogradskyella sp.]
MTFPATHNVTYYKGDTYEFNVYPKTNSDSDGDGVNDVFPLSGYSVDFTIAERRGTLLSTDSDAVSGYAVFSADRTHILCAIPPTTGSLLDASKTYVYDITISKSDPTYNKVYTLLSGNLSVQDRVEPVETESVDLPSFPTSLTMTDATSSSITLGWTAPVLGGTPDGYYVYVTPYSASYENSVVLQQLVDALALATPESVSQESATLTATTAISSLGIESVAIQPGTAYVYAVASFNTAGTSAAVGNFDITEGTVDEVFTDGGS